MMLCNQIVSSISQSGNVYNKEKNAIVGVTIVLILLSWFLETHISIQCILTHNS